MPIRHLCAIGQLDTWNVGIVYYKRQWQPCRIHKAMVIYRRQSMNYSKLGSSTNDTSVCQAHAQIFNEYKTNKSLLIDSENVDPEVEERKNQPTTKPSAPNCSDMTNSRISQGSAPIHWLQWYHAQLHVPDLSFLLVQLASSDPFLLLFNHKSVTNLIQYNTNMVNKAREKSSQIVSLYHFLRRSTISLKF